MPEEYTKGGDYILKELTLENFDGDRIDISGLFASLSFMEDIFSNTIFGQVLIYDTLDLTQFLPILGQEKLIFKYATDADSDTLVRVFYVYKIGKKEQESMSASNYLLYFTSMETLADQNTKVSRSYKQEKASYICTDIYEQYIRSAINGEDRAKPLATATTTMDVHDVVIPNWTPFEAINWLCSFARNPNNTVPGASHYLFYENRNGFHFTDIENLKNQEPVTELAPKLAGIANNQGPDGGQIRPGDTFTEARIVKTSDSLKNVMEGLYGSRTVAYDNVSKQIRSSDFSYQNEYSNMNHLGNFPLNQSDTFEFQDTRQKMNVVPTTSYRGNSDYFSRHGGRSNTGSTRYEEIAPFRSSVLSQLMSNQVSIMMYGNTEFTAGQVFNVVLPNMTSLEKEQKQKGQNYLTANMLMTQCKHTFTADNHIINALFVKDSFENRPANRMTGNSEETTNG